MGMLSTAGKGLQRTGFSTIRYGLALNLLSIGRLKFESHEVANIRPLVIASPLFARLVTTLGEQKLARLFGVTELAMGALIAARPFAPRGSALGSLGATGIFATTLSFLATTPEAWQERRGAPKLSLAGQFLVKDIVLLGASLLTAAESLQAGQRTSSTTTRATSSRSLCHRPATRCFWGGYASARPDPTGRRRRNTSTAVLAPGLERASSQWWPQPRP